MNYKANKTQFIISNKTTIDKANFVILPIPYEMTTSYGHGTANGPQAILKASEQLELWDEEVKEEIYKTGIFTLENYKFVKSEKIFFENIVKDVENLLSVIKGTPIFLGGEHSITQGLIEPFSKKYKDLSILHFDAHADLRLTYQGSIHSHACALYPASRKNKVVQIGIRSVGADEKQFVNQGLVKTFFMHENLDIDSLINKISKELSENVYLTIDVDGFDPSVMPATGTPQPGGFMWYEAMKIFKSICYKKNIVAMDIVEVAPNKAGYITEFNAAKLIYRLMGYIAEKKKLF